MANGWDHDINLAMLTDFYEITMSNAVLQRGHEGYGRGL